MGRVATFYLSGHISATIWSREHDASRLALARSPRRGVRVLFAEKGIFIMRKIVLAAAVATSALGLAACGETADAVADTGEAIAADAGSVVEAGTDAVGDAAEATGDAVEGAADATTEAAEGAADAATDTVEGAADSVTDAAEAAADKAEALVDGE